MEYDASVALSMTIHTSVRLKLTHARARPLFNPPLERRDEGSGLELNPHSGREAVGL